MKRAIICVVVIVLCLALVQVIRGRTTQQERGDRQRYGYDASRENDSTTVEYFVKNAKAKGLDRIIYPSPLVNSPKVVDVDEVIDRFSTIVLTPLEKTSQIAFLGAGLETLYRCKVTETLNVSKKANCCGAKDLRDLVRNLPTELPKDEMYLYVGGGSIVVDGIEVVQDEQPTGLELGHTYLVFLAHDETSTTGLLRLGEKGIFEVHSDGRLESKTSTSNPLADDIRGKLNNSLQRLRGYIERKRVSVK